MCTSAPCSSVVFDEEDKLVFSAILETMMARIPGGFYNDCFAEIRDQHGLLTWAQHRDSRPAAQVLRTVVLLSVGSVIQEYEHRAIEMGAGPLMGADWGNYDQVLKKVFTGLATDRQNRVVQKVRQDADRGFLAFLDTWL